MRFSRYIGMGIFLICGLIGLNSCAELRQYDREYKAAHPEQAQVDAALAQRRAQRAVQAAAEENQRNVDAAVNANADMQSTNNNMISTDNGNNEGQQKNYVQNQGYNIQQLNDDGLYGCGMSDDEFSAILKKTEKLVYSRNREEMIRAISEQTMSAAQVAKLVEANFNNVNDKARLISILYEAVCDKQNWYLVYDVLNYTDRNKLMEYQKDIAPRKFTKMKCRMTDGEALAISEYISSNYPSKEDLVRLTYGQTTFTVSQLEILIDKLNLYSNRADRLKEYFKPNICDRYNLIED